MTQLSPYTQGVSRAVYRGLLDLLKYFLTYIDEELQVRRCSIFLQIHILHCHIGPIFSIIIYGHFRV